jgi:ubiquinol-cytochrome c reductase cytochrome b subunit
VFTFSVQVISGLFLWMAYSPSAQTAWESVYYIQHEMQGGWLLRGLHHYTAQAMVVLLALHLLQVVIDGAYRAPREINFWIGLILMQIVLALSLTGYLLPWDQKGYWATRVATNLMGLAPLGAEGQTVVVGGVDYGHHTLTRFFALHAGLLPGLLVLLLVLHVALFRKHGIKAREPIKHPDSTFWPDQVLKDAIACLAVLVVVLLLILKPAIVDGKPLEPRYLGADLGAPADPLHSYDAARPEWYFLFLFQFLKYFPAELNLGIVTVPGEAIAAIVVPAVVMLVLFAMPLVGRWKWGHAFNVVFLLLLLFGGVVPLTYLAWHADHRGPDSAAYLRAVKDAEDDARRAVELAQSPRRIPVEGAAEMLSADPHTQGKRLFQQWCAGCHDALAEPLADKKRPTDLGASLRGFGSRAWASGFLDPQRIASPEYFGHTRHAKGRMVKFVKGPLKKWKKQDVENVVLALSAEAKLPSQREADRRDAQRIAAGRKLLADDTEGCAQCHQFHDVEPTDEPGPDLTGHASREWMVAFISNPRSDRFYAETDEKRGMPAFAPGPAGSPSNTLTRDQIERIVEYLRGEHRPSPPATAAVR